jgi:hypothetical protein
VWRIVLGFIRMLHEAVTVSIHPKRDKTSTGTNRDILVRVYNWLSIYNTYLTIQDKQRSDNPPKTLDILYNKYPENSTPKLPIVQKLRQKNWVCETFWPALYFVPLSHPGPSDTGPVLVNTRSDWKITRKGCEYSLLSPCQQTMTQATTVPRGVATR